MTGSDTSRIIAYRRLTNLPAFHPTAVRLLAIPSQADSAMADFERVFKADVALAAELLRAANSPAYGLQSRIKTIRHALAVLGLERVRGLACHIMFGTYLRHLRAEQMRPLWLHSIATAVIAETLGTMYHLPGLYTAGLLHDLGRLGLSLTAGEPYGQTLAVENISVEEEIDREIALCGMNHCDAGALLAQAWGFPELFQVTMVEHHGHWPGASESPIALIQSACRMAAWLGFPERPSHEFPPLSLLPQPLLDAPQLEPQRVLDLIRKQTATLDP